MKSPELVEEARSLYREGYSYGAIHHKLGVARSTVTLWCKDIAFELREKRGVIRHAPLDPDKIKISQFALHPFEGWRIQKATPVGDLERLKLQNIETREIFTITKARYLMSVHLGRMLDKDERIVFVEGREAVIENLRLVKRPKKDKSVGPRKKRELKPLDQRKSPILYTNKCEICEGDFKTTVETKDICNQKECRDIFKELSNLEV